MHIQSKRDMKLVISEFDKHPKCKFISAKISFEHPHIQIGRVCVAAAVVRFDLRFLIFVFFFPFCSRCLSINSTRLILVKYVKFYMMSNIFGA